VPFTGFLRSLGVMATVLPSLLVGLAVLAAGRGRQRAANAMIGVWIRLAPKAAGLGLEVQNAERIDASRPAVFLFNHQSSVDILILCMLLRRDFTGVAKQELRRHWVFGPAFAFAGAVFIDRFDRPKAVAALQPAVDVVRGGISVGIAPEGTRSRDGGPMRRGKRASSLISDEPSNDPSAPAARAARPLPSRCFDAPARPSERAGRSSLLVSWPRVGMEGGLWRARAILRRSPRRAAFGSWTEEPWWPIASASGSARPGPASTRTTTSPTTSSRANSMPSSVRSSSRCRRCCAHS
jgi:1-acyl-sn-glycerol-3-phosphate acyltransferase